MRKQRTGNSPALWTKPWRCSMAKHSWWLRAAVTLLAVCLLGGDPGAATAGPGYLPVVGPVPVRFQTPSPVVPVVLWPPLLQPEKQAVGSEAWPPLLQPDKQALGEAQTTNAPAAEALGMESPSNPVAPSTTSTDAGAADLPPPDLAIPFPLPAPNQPERMAIGMADPQVVLNYLLSASTNEPGAKVIMPIFVPPAPPVPFPSSHATYESR
jgi:hypothetical protein